MRLKSRYNLLIIVVLFVLPQQMPAGQWAVNAGFQWLQGNYASATSISSLYFSGGLSYRASRWSVAVNLPVMLQNNVLEPNGSESLENYTNSRSGKQSNPNFGPPGSNVPSTQVRWGIGDTYVYGEFRILGNPLGLAALNVTGTLKFPTASAEKNMGTGKWDYSIGLSLQKFAYPFSLFLDGGYLIIGDPIGVTYQDPFIFGAGVGRMFGQGRYSVLFYYQYYSRILSGYQPPQQLNVAGFARLSTRVVVSANFIVGFSESSPDFGVLTTIEYSFKK